jgi:hypothetical protein
MGLWAKYAADHSGYCLEFVNEGPLFEQTLEVIYGESIQMDVTKPKHRTGYWFFCKRQEWSNEEEVRIILPRSQGTKIRIDPRWLKRIILGWHMSENNQTMIREWAKQRLPELTVVNAEYDEVDQAMTKWIKPSRYVTLLRLPRRMPFRNGHGGEGGIRTPDTR